MTNAHVMIRLTVPYVVYIQLSNKAEPEPLGHLSVQSLFYNIDLEEPGPCCSLPRGMREGFNVVF